MKTIIASLCAVFLLGCTTPPPSENVMCTLEARAGIQITLTDPNGNAIQGASITSPQYGGSFWEMQHEPGLYVGLNEGEGRYTYTIQKDGYETYTGEVFLEQDVCHVITQKTAITLQPIQ